MDMDDLLRELDDIPGDKKGASRPSPGAPSKPSPARPSIPSSSSAPHVTTSQSSPQLALSHARSASASGTSTTPQRTMMSSMMDDLDLHSISPSDPGITPRRPANASLQQSSDALGSSATRSGPRMKCAMLYLGGTRFERGRNGATSGSGDPVVCDALRCTKCDFKVVMTRDRQWSDGADYLFFRNNYPDEAKLAPMQRRLPGSCAYCCQCSWVASANETRVDFGGELRWVCGGHS